MTQGEVRTQGITLFLLWVPNLPQPDPAQRGEPSRSQGPKVEPGSVERQPQRMSLAHLFLENYFHPLAYLSQHLEQKDTGFHTASSNIFPPYSKLLLLWVWSQDGHISVAWSLLGTQKLGSPGPMESECEFWTFSGDSCAHYNLGSIEVNNLHALKSPLEMWSDESCLISPSRSLTQLGMEKHHYMNVFYDCLFLKFPFLSNYLEEYFFDFASFQS